MPIQFSTSLASNTRVEIRSSPSTGPDQAPVFTLAKPSLGARIGRGALNVLSHLACFIPGVKYTKNHHNPAQWQAFKYAVLATHSKDIQSGKLTEEKLATILEAYSPHKRLTQGKAAAVLEDVRRSIAGQTPVARQPERLNASQSAPLRGLRTLKVRLKGLNEAGRVLRDQVARDTSPKADAIRDVLRPGQKLSTPSIKAGQIALETYAHGKANFAWTGRGMDADSLDFSLNTIIAEGSMADIARLKQAARDQPDKPAILSIPLALRSKAFSLHEDHSVELAVDFRANKLLFLDAKGESIEMSSKTYDNGDIKAALERFGRTVFGQDWEPATGIIQLTQAKQQGANDCGAFTHEFTRRLIDGQSVGDIERDFDKDDRRALRIEMARDIDAYHGEPDPVEGPQPAAVPGGSFAADPVAGGGGPKSDSFEDDLDFFDQGRVKPQQ
jgi:hypothetical protein